MPSAHLPPGINYSHDEQRRINGLEQSWSPWSRLILCNVIYVPQSRFMKVIISTEQISKAPKDKVQPKGMHL